LAQVLKKLFLILPATLPSMADAMDVEFELSQQLVGHDSAVRCVMIMNETTLVSGGLDAQVIVWQRPSETAGFERIKTLCHHSDWVNALAASSEVPGCFYSASKDKTAFRIDQDGNPVNRYEGHKDSVCSVVERGSQVVTGSWDGTAKVWDSSTAECRHTLEAGPPRAIAVAVLPTGEIVTGAQDASLRVFRGDECVRKLENAHGSVIRSICVASTQVYTASNDQSLKIWSLDFCEMGSLNGHQSFVYSVARSSDGQSLYSTSEDCTMKTWSLSDSSCTQSILHAKTVWQAAALTNGDVATACEDCIVRVWTRDPARMAAEAERQVQKEMAQNAAVEAAKKGSSSTTVEKVDAADISEMLTTVGKKNGEIKCFKEGETVWACSWNAGARCWDKIGEVTGQSSKKHYPGDFIFPKGDYDYVFDVDMGPDRQALLPYNKGENPMAVAERFIAREQINKGNLDQIRNFIMANAGEDAVSASSAPAPQAAPAPAAPSAPSGPSTSIFPLHAPLTFKDGKYEPLQKKLMEFQGQVGDEFKLDTLELQYLNDAIQKLSTGSLRTEFKQVEREVIHEKLGTWPKDKLFPVMDLWRLYVLHPQSSDYFKGSDRGAPLINKVLGCLTDPAGDPLTMCCVRWLANMMTSQTNRSCALDRRSDILKAVKPCLASSNKNIKIASATVLLNFAIVLHEFSFPPKPWDASCAADIAQAALEFLGRAGPDDVDATQRAILTLGTLFPRDKQNGCNIAKACKEADLPGKLRALEGKVDSKIVAELMTYLG